MMAHPPPFVLVVYEAEAFLVHRSHLGHRCDTGPFVV